MLTRRTRAYSGVFTRSMQQTSSKLPANVFKIRVLMVDVFWIVQTVPVRR